VLFGILVTWREAGPRGSWTVGWFTHPNRSGNLAESNRDSPTRTTRLNPAKFAHHGGQARQIPSKRKQACALQKDLDLCAVRTTRTLKCASSLAPSTETLYQASCHCLPPPAAGGPFLESELIFPLETWHNHASCIVEAPNGDLWVCWFHGSGERTADDVKIEGACRRSGERQWSPRMTLADTPGYPDTNCAMFVDPAGRIIHRAAYLEQAVRVCRIDLMEISSVYRKWGDWFSVSCSIFLGLLVVGRLVKRR